MSSTGQPNTPESRHRARSRLRRLTSGALVAATGATVAIGVVISHDHPGKAAGSARSGSAGSGSTAAGDSASSGNTGSTGNTGNTGNTGSSSTPTNTTVSPTVTSGGSSG